MICRNGLPGGSRNRKRVELLRDARSLLAQMQRLHVCSHDIGRAEQAGLTEIMGEQIRFSRATIENADRLCAEIALHFENDAPIPPPERREK